MPMSPSPPRRVADRAAGPKPRPELSRALILDRALALIDERGLDALSMRELGVALGAATMSVYRHFRYKGELLDAVMDEVVEAFAPTGPQADWRAEARALSRNVRRAMLAHPDLADLIGREFRRSDASLRVNIQIIERLRAGGAPEAFLAHAYWALSSYTTGFALLEAQALRRRRGAPAKPSAPPQRKDKIARLMAGVDGVSPAARDTAAAVLARPLDDAQFEFGLDCIIRGLGEVFAGEVGTQTEA
jgi:AcrR family transcriptional regulator